MAMSTKQINLNMKLGVGSVLALLLLAFQFCMYSPRITGRQILGSRWPELVSDDNSSLQIGAGELQKCRGPIVEMLAGDQSITLNGKRFERADDLGSKPMLVEGPN